MRLAKVVGCMAGLFEQCMIRFEVGRSIASVLEGTQGQAWIHVLAANYKRSQRKASTLTSIHVCAKGQTRSE